MQRRGWRSRGYLPHIDEAGLTQFLTWRLADSLPAEVLEEWRLDLESDPSERRKREWQRRIEKYLDAGHGQKLLSNPVAARIVQENLILGHGKMYELHAWSVMPTHVHALLTPLDPWPLAKIMHRLKGRTSNFIGK